MKTISNPVLGLATAMIAITAFAVSATALADSGSGSGGDRTRFFECKADSATLDASMDGKFEQDGDRRKFDASFEAAPNIGFNAGDMLQVLVGGVAVGNITLAVLLNGDVGGDLDFDSTAGPGDDDLPFPVNFPTVGAGALVQVGTLMCNLQVD